MNKKMCLAGWSISVFFLGLTLVCAEEMLVDVISAGGTEVAIKDSGPQFSTSSQEGHTEHRWMLRTLDIDTGKVKYQMKYEGCVDKAHESGYDSALNGIGMSKPSMANWYYGSFFTLEINNENIIARYPAEVTIAAQGERGIIDFDYGKPYKIKLRFMALPDDDKLFFKIDLDSKAMISSLKMNLTAYPVTFTKAYNVEGERWIKSLRLDGKQGEVYELKPKDDWWIVYYDKVLDSATNKEGGPGCGLLFLPEELKKGQVKVTDYAIETMLDLCPVNSSIRLILWDFAHEKRPNAEVIDDLKMNGEKYRRQLEDLEF